MTVLRGAAATDVGRVRTVNEDRYLVAEGIFAVADGLGGHQAGEVASKAAVEALLATFTSRSVDSLMDAAAESNRAVWQMARDNPDLQGMATTLTAVALIEEDGEERLAVINVGDSRAYLLQRNELMQLTEDHSLVEQLVREGRLTSEEAAVHPQRSVITRALGLDPEVEVDVWQLLPYAGDRIVLCSDGLTNEVADADIASTLRRCPDPDKAARDLVVQARAHGGSDNITVVVVDIVDDDGRAAEASAALASSDDSDLPAPNDRGRDPEPTASEAGRGATAVATRPWPQPVARQAPASDPVEHRSRITWRVVAFVVGLLAVAIVVVGAIGWYARHTYYVGIDGQNVAIFKGRPGGLLWFKPSVEQRTQLRVTDVGAAHVGDLTAGHSEPTLADAQRYTNNLRQEAAARSASQIVPPVPPAVPPTTTTLPPP